MTCLSPIAASANTLSLILGDIGGFSQLTSSGAVTTTVNNGLVPDGTAVTITSIFGPPQVGVQSANVGLAGLNIAFLGGDLSALNLENTNENPWNYQLVAVTDQRTFMSAALSWFRTPPHRSWPPLAGSAA